jgi:hypothetical protein
MFGIRLGIFSISILGLLLTACTRPQADTSKVSLTIPLSSAKNSSQSLSATPNYIAINIAGGDKATIFCARDLERKSTEGPCSFTDTSVEISEVDNANNRLIQVLMVYNDSSNNTMSFKYADATVNLPSSSAIAISPVLVGGAQVGGNVRGRILSGVDTGPSGLMTVLYPPENGKPPMIVQKVEVYSGWFDAFSLETTALDYVIDGVSIFKGPMTKAKFIARAVESGYSSRVYPETAGANDYQVFGFFSAGDSSLVSGKTAQTSNCTNATAYLTCFSPNLRIRGPFRANSVGDYLTLTGSAPTTIAWNYLPGVDSTWFDGVAVYSATVDLTTADLDRLVMSRGFNCDGFATTAGVQLLGAVAMGAPPQLSATLAAFPTSKRPLAVCPKMGLKLKTAAAVLPQIDNNGGCPECKYLRLEISSYAESLGDKYNLGINGCYPISLGAYRGQGAASSDNTYPISLVVPDPTWAHFYNDSSCTSPVGGSLPLTIAAGQSTTGPVFWMRPTTVGNDFEIAGTVSSDPSNGFIAYQKEYNKMNVLNPLTKLTMPTGPILSNICYEGTLSVTMQNGFSLPVPYGATTDNLSGSNIVFGSDATSCAGSVSSALSQNMNSFPSDTFWFKAVTAGTVSVAATATSFDTSLATATAISSANLAAVKIRVTPLSSLTLNQCTEFRVELLNSNDIVVPAATAVQVNLPPSDVYGYWASDANCNSVTDNVAIPVMSSGRSVYFYSTNTGTPSLNFASSSGASFQLSPTISAPLDATVPWVKVASLPRFPKGYGSIGEHNFPITVGLSVPVGATLKCYQGYSPPMPSSSSWSDCGGRLSGTSIAFGVSGANDLGTSPSDTTLIQATLGTKTAILALNKARIFGNTSFTKVSCGAVVPAGTFDSLATAISGSSSICLEAGVFAKGAGTAAGISLPSGKSLYGKINTADGAPATVLQVNGSSGGIGVNLQSLSGSTYISNIKFDVSGSGTSRHAIYSNSGSSGTIVTFGNVFEISSTTGGSANGITTSGLTGISLNSTADIFNVASAISGGTSAGLNLAPSGNSSQIQFDKFTMTSTDISNGSVGLLMAVPVSAPTSYINVVNSEFSGAGAGIRALGQSVSGSVSLELSINQSKIDMADTAYSLAYPVYIQDNVGTSITETKIRNQISGKPGLKYYQASSGGAYSGGNFMTLNRNVFQQYAATSVIMIGSASYDLTSSRQVTVEANHFVKRGGGTSPYAIMGGAGSYSIYLVRNGSSPGDGNNIACGYGSNLWSQAYGGSSAIASSVYQWSPAAAITSLSDGEVCLP